TDSRDGKSSRLMPLMFVQPIFAKAQYTNAHGVVSPWLPVNSSALAISFPSGEFMSTPLPDSWACQSAGIEYVKYSPRLMRRGGRVNTECVGRAGTAVPSGVAIGVDAESLVGEEVGL